MSSVSGSQWRVGASEGHLVGGERAEDGRQPEHAEKHLELHVVEPQATLLLLQMVANAAINTDIITKVHRVKRGEGGQRVHVEPRLE